MDSLTHLIQLIRPQASLQVRCTVEGSFYIEHPREAEGAIPFHLVLEGACVIKTISGKLIPMKKGDFILFPNGCPHTICCTGDKTEPAAPFRMDYSGMLPRRINAEGTPDADLLCGRFMCVKGQTTLLFSSLPDPFFVSLGETQTSKSLQTLVALMREESDNKQAGALAIVSSLSQALLTMALRAHAESHPDLPSVVRLLSDTRLAPSVQALMADPARAWTIDDLAEKSAMSRATYTRHFRANAGISVAEFLTQIRLTTAGDLLLTTNRSAADIGMAVGYQSEAAFGKAFRVGTGLTPGRYRQQRKEEVAA